MDSDALVFETSLERHAKRYDWRDSVVMGQAVAHNGHLQATARKARRPCSEMPTCIRGNGEGNAVGTDCCACPVLGQESNVSNVNRSLLWSTERTRLSTAALGGSGWEVSFLL